MRVVARSRRMRRSRSWTRSRGGCARSAPGTASRTSARSSPTRSRRPTSWRDAANRGDDSKLIDELGDVLFQVHFLSLLLEERGAGDLAEVAEHVTAKLIRRHPHVFGDVDAVDRAGGAAQLGPDQAGRARPRAGDLRRGPREPALAAATRARCSAAPPPPASTSRGSRGSCRRVREELAELEQADTPERRFSELGDLLFVGDQCGPQAARRSRASPLRSSADRFRARVSAASDLAASQGRSWNDLGGSAESVYYAQARLSEGDPENQ